MKRLIGLLLVALFGVQCMPSLKPASVAVRSQYLFADSYNTDSISLGGNWWELFGDTTLNRLVERALDSNRNLWVATSRIEEARHNLAVARAEFLPSFGTDISPSASYNRTTKIAQQYSVEFTTSWEISLFGRLKRTSEAARAEIATAVWNYRGVALALAAEVATTYFTLLQYERDLLIASRTYTLRRESAALIDSMFSYGMSDGVERKQAQALVASAAADIPRYRNAIDDARLSLAVLMGDVPNSVTDEGTGSELLTDYQPDAIAIGVPSELLQRRPDILEARYALDAAAARAGLARSDRFPSITLSANGGVGANSIKGLTSSNPAVWSAVGGLVQPIYNFGRLKRSEKAAVEQYNQAAYSYEQTVIEAFAEVENALATIEAMRLETERYTELVAAYREVVDMAYALYRNGMVDYLDIIDAERTFYEAQTELVNLWAQQYINYVTLCKALGGGWKL